MRRFAYRLARRLGYLDVDVMLSTIPGWKLLEWEAFYELEPDGDEKTEWGLAHIVQAIMRTGKPLIEYLLPFGDRPGREPVKQTIEYQEMVIDAWIMASNAALMKK